jgi:hypothetical protein
MEFGETLLEQHNPPCLWQCRVCCCFRSFGGDIDEARRVERRNGEWCFKISQSKTLCTLWPIVHAGPRNALKCPAGRVTRMNGTHRCALAVTKGHSFCSIILPLYCQPGTTTFPARVCVASRHALTCIIIENTSPFSTLFLAPTSKCVSFYKRSSSPH